MATVGSHQQAPFTTPLNATSPVDADEVRLNDNALQTTYNAHDSDATIHVQSSTLSLRPPAGTEGRLWFTSDTRRYYYDDGVSWLALTVSADDLTAGTLAVARGGTGLSTIPTNGQLLIGNGTTYTLGTLSAGTNIAITNAAGSITIAATGGVSDRRLKTAIAPADDAGPVVDQITIVQHDWRSGGHVRFAVVAQDLAAIVPEAVTVGDTGDTVTTPWRVEYGAVVPLLIQTTQQLRQRVATLEQQVAMLTEASA